MTANDAFLTVPPANPFFSLDDLIEDCIREQDLAKSLSLFSLSLLTQSPLSSPPSSPTPPPMTLEPVASTSKDTVFLPTVRPPQPSKVSRPKNKPPQPKNPDRKLAPNRKARRNAAANSARKKRRERRRKGPDPSPHGLVHGEELYVDTAEAIECKIDFEGLRIAKGAYVAMNDRCQDRTLYALNDMVGPSSKWKFRLQKWDGKYDPILRSIFSALTQQYPSKPMALIDNKNRVIGVLAGHPRDDNWPKLQKQAAAALESCRSRCEAPTKDSEAGHRRGMFVALQCGVSHGGGQRRPSNLYNTPPNAEVLRELNDLEPFKRVAGFSSSVLATWAPGLHKYYKETANALHSRYPELVRIFSCGIFSSYTYNLGPCTVCFKHKDIGNLSFGMCSVTCFGDFDYTKGGHLILWDLKLVIEFPPGATILLPSAIIAHSNVSIGQDETRYSFAQYTAGGTFRWVGNEFQNQELYKAKLSKEELKAYNERQDGRLAHGLSLLLTLPPAV